MRTYIAKTDAWDDAGRLLGFKHQERLAADGWIATAALQVPSLKPDSNQPAAGSPSTNFHVASIGMKRGAAFFASSVTFPISWEGVSGVFISRTAKTLSFSRSRFLGNVRLWASLRLISSGWEAGLRCDR